MEKLELIRDDKVNDVKLISQEQLLSDVRAHLAWDTRIDDYDVVVAISGRVVSLSGSVSSPYEKTVAEKSAYGVSGVANVINALTVRPKRVSNPKNDKDIQAIVESALSAFQTIESDRFTIIVAHGCVTLTGKIQYLWQKRKVEEIVGAIKGVLDLCNALEVEVSTDVSDEKIAVDINNAFSRSKFIQEGELSIEVHEGKVTVNGTVSTDRFRNAVVSVVENTLGVVALRNLVLVD